MYSAMTGLDFLKKKPPVSPNKPPAASMAVMRIPQKGQPIPIDVNLLIHGDPAPRSAIAASDVKPRYRLPEQLSIRPKSVTAGTNALKEAGVDENVLKTLNRPPSVDISYYDKFERLDRDYVDGDKAFKEKGGRIKSAGKRVANNLKVKKRAQSADIVGQKMRMDVNRSLDIGSSIGSNVTLQTQPHLKHKSRRKSAGRRGNHSSILNRPQSGKLMLELKARERSQVRRERSRSKSRSEGSASVSTWCSSRVGRTEKRHRKTRTRKSRSRTRHPTPRYANVASGPTHIQERKSSALRTDSRKRHSTASGSIHSQERKSTERPSTANKHGKEPETKRVQDTQTQSIKRTDNTRYGSGVVRSAETQQITIDIERPSTDNKRGKVPETMWVQDTQTQNIKHTDKKRYGSGVVRSSETQQNNIDIERTSIANKRGKIPATMLVQDTQTQNIKRTDNKRCGSGVVRSAETQQNNIDIMRSISEVEKCNAVSSAHKVPDDQARAKKVKDKVSHKESTCRHKLADKLVKLKLSLISSTARNLEKLSAAAINMRGSELVNKRTL